MGFSRTFVGNLLRPPFSLVFALALSNRQRRCRPGPVTLHFLLQVRMSILRSGMARESAPPGSMSANGYFERSNCHGSILFDPPNLCVSNHLWDGKFTVKFEFLEAVVARRR